MASAVKQIIETLLPAVHVTKYAPASGTRHFLQLDEWFASITYAILCITPENRYAPWIHYEAGVFAHKPASRVVPLLLDLTVQDLSAPLDQRGVRLAEPHDVALLISDIAHEFGQAAPSRRAVKHLWNDLFEDRRERLEHEVKACVDTTNPVHACIRDHCESISSHHSTTFRRYIARNILAQCDAALQEIADRQIIFRSANEFIDAAEIALKSGDRAFALCGGKPWGRRAKDRYYRNCYDFAERVSRERKLVGEPVMTRLFLRQRDPARRAEQSATVRDHYRLRDKGVRGRMIKPEGRKLPIAAELKDLMLNEGFGFMLVDSRRPVALVHRGTAKGQFFGAELRTSYAVAEVRDLFRKLNVCSRDISKRDLR